jgi:hypothetical protein
MIYRGLGFPVIKLHRRHTRRLRKRDNLLTYRTLLTYYYTCIELGLLPTAVLVKLVLPTTILENKLYVLQYFLITWFNYYDILQNATYLTAVSVRM